ncbi:4-aminobutyrate--2-oxoglutarate transaminase [Metallumcola ferriviriculae]|uniref:4-aminobutyrate aminotransferase n=1 Tax=Metallumcola ferriviriculae TaxID=3039180 RepID=A0AAU0URB4_9FIRM|nr:4-aminobutyrate--2-oxoglutarate transaminase [Desulfitibacteraceae bacterium MK1]
MSKIVTEVPGPRSQELMKLRQEFVARGPGNVTPVFIEKGKGAVITDVDGNEFIDFAAGIGVLNVGHCPDEVVNVVKEQAEKFLHSCFHVNMYEPYIKLAQKLAEITPGDFAKKTMMANSGAEAVENAVKIARKYTGRMGLISLESAFHGRTLMTMSLTSKVKPYKFGFGPFAPETYKIPSANCYRCSFNSTYPECGLHCVEHLERFFVAEFPAEHVAALIAEPVQGEGGFIVPPKEFIQGIKKICEKNDILYISDEVQAGFGRTGSMFAIEHFGVEPDLITMSKSLASGMPLSAVTGRAEVMDAPAPGEIGGTFGGNPLSCVAALEVIKKIEREKLIQRSTAIGERMMGRLRQMQEKYPAIGDVRGLGAMVAIELVKDRATKEPDKELTGKIAQTCYENGLITMTAGIYGNVIRFLTPLVITDDQVDEGLDILEKAFQINA